MNRIGLTIFSGSVVAGGAAAAFYNKQVDAHVAQNRDPLAALRAMSSQQVTVAVPQAAEKWNARYSHPVPHTDAYYYKCMLGGVLSCGLTHLAVTPLDVTKCNMQVS